MELLNLKGAGKSYSRGGIFNAGNKFDVLADICLSIAPGTCLGLLGRSGSGKSTLGRLALGLERPDAGAVFYRGKSVWDMPKKEYREFRRNIQVVFQNSPGSVNPRFTAARIIAEPLHNFESLSAGDLRRKVAELLEQVGLRSEDGAKYPHQFSGGELQRVCIARAIALNPRLIVLDEAVSSLDMLIQARIIELLRTLQRSMGTAYLFISHDIRVLVKMADRLAVLDKGQIVEELSVSDSVSRPYHPAFAELISAILPPVPEDKKESMKDIQTAGIVGTEGLFN
ncbi:MAG: ATP-binding cassette domain-containing protein [Desulfobacteraceae bacterium]|nr:ATP-binding cassette domain-containing protein [Desulfobacteraceae bacterium]